MKALICILSIFISISSIASSNSIKKRKQLVRKVKNDILIYSEEDANFHPTLLKAVDYSYIAGKNKKVKMKILESDFEKNGWNITKIKGISGIPGDEKSDTPLFILYNEKLSTLLLSFRGTHTSPLEKFEGRRPFSLISKKISTDWKSNYDFVASSTNDLVKYLNKKKKTYNFKYKFSLSKKNKKKYLKIISEIKEGLLLTKNFQQDFPSARNYKFYRGYLYEFMKMYPSLRSSLDNIFVNMSKEVASNLKVYITGHSQGGGQALLSSPFITKIVKSKLSMKLNIDSNDLDNKDINIIKVHAFSSPRVFQGNYTLNWAEKIVGKHNVVRQNIINDISIFQRDLVPFIGFNEYVSKFLNLSIFGKIISKKYANYKDFGYLAGDHFSDAYRRNASNGKSILNAIKSESDKNYKSAYSDLKTETQWKTLGIVVSHYGSSERRINEEIGGRNFCLKCADVENRVNEEDIYGKYPILISKFTLKTGSQCNKNFPIRLNNNMNDNSYTQMINAQKFSDIIPNNKIYFYKTPIVTTKTSGVEYKSLSILLNQGQSYKDRMYGYFN